MNTINQYCFIEIYKYLEEKHLIQSFVSEWIY